MPLKKVDLKTKVGGYFTRIDESALDGLNWKRIRHDGLFVFVLGAILTMAYSILGFVLSLVLCPLSFFRSIEIWLMPLGPDKASHFIVGVESHLRRTQLDNRKNLTTILVWPQKFPNEALATLYKRLVNVVGPEQKFFARILPFVIWKVDVRSYSVNEQSIAIQIIDNDGKPSVEFSKDEIRTGKDLIFDIFGDENKSFILFGYTSPKYRALVDQSYHPTDDLVSAIPDPLNFVKMIGKMNGSGIGVVRQGLHLDETKELSRVGLVIPNYEKFASGFPDVWLAANCRFLVSACTGSWWFGFPFNKPAVITDVYTPVGLRGLKSNLIIFQLPWNLKEQRHESFAWMSANPRWCYDVEKVGFEYTNINNSPEQIIDVVDEQLARLNGTWVETDEDVELQQRFQRFVWGRDADPAYLPRVGAKFLREHQHLLPD